MKAFSINTIPVSTISQQSAIILHLHEAVKPSNHEAIISAVKSYLAGGHTHLIVDMLGVSRLSLTTLFTLYSLVALANNQPLANPEEGWQALHEMKNKFSGRSVANMNLCAVQPSVAQALQQGGLADVVELWPTLNQAVNAFSPADKTAVTPIMVQTIPKSFQPGSRRQTAVAA